MLEKPKKTKKSLDYGPTIEELGYTKGEFDSIDWFNNHSANIEHERRINAFILNHREKLKAERRKIKEQRLDRYIDHWYSVLKEDEIIEAINKSRQLSDEVFDKITKKETLPGMIKYYNNLRHKVKHGKMTITPADIKKIARFPIYEHGSKSLSGSAYSFMKLWAHVFSERRVKGSVFTTK